MTSKSRFESKCLHRGMSVIVQVIMKLMTDQKPFVRNS